MGWRCWGLGEEGWGSIVCAEAPKWVGPVVAEEAACVGGRSAGLLDVSTWVEVLAVALLLSVSWSSVTVKSLGRAVETGASASGRMGRREPDRGGSEGNAMWREQPMQRACPGCWMLWQERQ